MASGWHWSLSASRSCKSNWVGEACLVLDVRLCDCGGEVGCVGSKGDSVHAYKYTLHPQTPCQAVPGRKRPRLGGYLEIRILSMEQPSGNVCTIKMHIALCVAHQGIDKGHSAAEALAGLAAGQEDVKGQHHGALGRQHCVLRTHRQHCGAAVHHLHTQSALHKRGL